MKSVVRDDGALVISSSPLVFRLVGAGMLGLSLALFLDRNPEPRQWIGVTGAAVLGLIFVAIADKTEFVFDRARRRVRWSRTSLLRQTGGEFGFDDLRGLAIERNRSRSSGSTKRLALVTTNGRIPLTTSYTNTGGGREEAIALIRQTVGADRDLPLHDAG